MKRGIILLILVFSLGLVSAGFFSTFTGKVIDGLEDNIYNMSEEDLAVLYEENEDFLTEENMDYAMEKAYNDGPEGAVDLYFDQEAIKDMILRNGNASLTVIFDIFPCSMISEFVGPQIIGTTIPDEVPLEDDVFNFYIDKEFIVSVELENKTISALSCDETEEFDYQIFVTSELVLDVALNYNEIDVVELYKENKKSGDIEIRARGLINKFKLLVLNVAVRFI